MPDARLDRRGRVTHDAAPTAWATARRQALAAVRLGRRRRVEILLAADAGSPARPLAKGASGGELSRVMLAIEVAWPAPARSRRSSSTRSTPASAAGPPSRWAARLASWPRHGPGPRRHPPAPGRGVRRPPRRGAQVSDGAVTTSGLTVLDADARERELSRMLAGMDDSDTRAWPTRASCSRRPPAGLLRAAAPGARPRSSPAACPDDFPADSMSRDEDLVTPSAPDRPSTPAPPGVPARPGSTGGCAALLPAAPAR